MKKLKRFIIPIFIPHEGCAFRCVFCDQYAVTGVGELPATPQAIRDTVVSYRETSPAWNGERELAFFGGSFTMLPDPRQAELLGAASDLISEGLIDAVRISTRPDGIDAVTVDRLGRYGVKTVEIGVQSMDDEVLRRSRRGHTAADSERAARRLCTGGIPWIAQIMPGMPGDTDDTMIQTARAVAELSPHGVRIYPALVLAGTALEALYRKGEYNPLSLAHTLEIVKEMTAIFEQRSIPILRIGLNPSVELERRVVAGPYHPALGSLVHESRMLDAIINQVDAVAHTQAAIELYVHPRDVSRAVGSRRSSIRLLERRYPGIHFTVVADDGVDRGRVRANGL